MDAKESIKNIVGLVKKNPEISYEKLANHLGVKRGTVALCMVLDEIRQGGDPMPCGGKGKGKGGGGKPPKPKPKPKGKQDMPNDTSDEILLAAYEKRLNDAGKKLWEKEPEWMKEEERWSIN